MAGGNTGSGGGFRPDAWWVVLLGVLSSVVTVLAYFGLKPPEPPAPPPSPGPTTTQSVPTSSATGSPPLTLSIPTPDPGPPPSEFNNVRTDPTPVSVATMLPQQYNDSGITFDRTSGSVHPCPAGNEAADVANILRNDGCTSEVVGTYLDSSTQIQVVVWVIPMPDVAAAEGVFNSSIQSGVSNELGIWCPRTGVGSQICQEQWRNATFDGRIGFCHRYVMHSYALYVDLRSDSAVLPALTSAATAANRSIGAHYIPGAQC